MIDWIKSSEINKMSIDNLKLWLKKFPKSGKKVWRVCEGEGCTDETAVVFVDSGKLCKKCAANTPEHFEKMSKISTARFADPHLREILRLKANKQWSDPEAIEAARLRTIEQFSTQATCDKMSRIKKQWFIDHPEAEEANRLRCVEYWANRDNRDAMSEIITNSEAAKVNADNMRGGNDIINHHWLYDDADLSKYTMPMTRKEHSIMHARMRRDDYKVPHINSKTDDNGLWEYK